MMHLYFGDTALHIALKWKRHRAVKALLSLRPDWTIPNESGSTAENLTLRVYGKDIATLKGEQEREYENDAMWDEEDAMRRCASGSNSGNGTGKCSKLDRCRRSRFVPSVGQGTAPSRP